MTGAHRIQGIPVAALAEQFGTPLYVYDGDRLASQFTGLRERLHPALDVFYSLKANPNIALCALLHELGAGAEISSLAELVTAQRAGVPGRDILVPGPGKSRAELRACIRAGVLAIVCESLGELALIDEVAAELRTVAPVMLRVNPAFQVKTSTLAMSGKPRQFGIDEARLLAHGPIEASTGHVRIIGVHVYMGTRLLEPQVVVENTVRILDLAERLSRRLRFPLEVVDIGGGLGVPYFDGEQEFDRDALATGINPVIADFRLRHPHTRLIMELGRYLVADAGTYVTQVRYVKESMGERFAIVDGGTNHHMAAVGIGSFVRRNFPLALLNRTGDGPTHPWNIAGPLCTPNDTLAKHVELPDLRPGDLIGVLTSGAYGASASPGLFLSHGYPAEILVRDAVAHLVREADQVTDLLRKQHLPPPPGRAAGEDDVRLAG